MTFHVKRETRKVLTMSYFSRRMMQFKTDLDELLQQLDEDLASEPPTETTDSDSRMVEGRELARKTAAEAPTQFSPPRSLAKQDEEKRSKRER